MTKPAELYACLYAKEFPAQTLLRLRLELRNRPCVVMEGELPLQQVCSLNTKGRLLGIAHGMTSVEVDTFPSVAVLTRSKKEEASTKTALLECARAFSPHVEDLSEDRAFLSAIDIAGTEKLLGPAETLARNLLHRVKALGIAACATVSSNRNAAISLAKGLPPRTAVQIIPRGDEATTLAPLPLRVLGLTEEHEETFSLWGIRTLGMLAALPEGELIARMGQEGKRLRQSARGDLPHLFQPMEPAFILEERIELDSPVEELPSLLFVVNIMLDQLILRARARVLALASVTVTLTLEDKETHTCTVRSALPTNDKQLWVKLLHLDLNAHPYQAAILSLTLSAEPGSTSKVQLGLFSPQLPEPMQLDVTLARIRAIVGDECVGSPVLNDTHQRKGFRMEPFTVSANSTPVISSNRFPSASRQLRSAENVSVTLQSQRPKAFVFRDKRYLVERIYGPWLTGGEWWNPTFWSLEQWDLVARAQDSTLLSCCLVRDLMQDRWQMAALYD
ncbi:DNA polymerase Y family protein [Tunturibacter empetritectus]|uniref:Protein ImuB n=1 Tax=Tunturiibacter lichenicola TaxID=2051959 RepID=A0A7W8N4M0_9BACT|nr:DNA polymerase Y family protein [Edaphobacter lichenicola]MBB5345737.1 protein ImuB [Edaphobacter lichenicola]